MALGLLAYGSMDEEEEHEEHGILAGDALMVAAVGGVLAVVALVSLAYIVRGPRGEG